MLLVAIAGVTDIRSHKIPNVVVYPGLAAALAGLDPASVTPFERVLVLRAVARLANHYRGLMLSTVGDLMLDHDPDYGQPADLPSGGGGELPDEPGANEVRAALVLSRRGANTLCILVGEEVLDHSGLDYYEGAVGAERKAGAR